LYFFNSSNYLVEPSKVVWTKNGVELQPSAHIKPTKKATDTVRTYGLEFTKLLLVDEGQYAVTIFSPDGKSITSQTELKITPREYLFVYCKEII
jgi:hypothetical protein